MNAKFILFKNTKEFRVSGNQFNILILFYFILFIHLFLAAP